MDRELVKALVPLVVDEIAAHCPAAEDAPQSGVYAQYRSLAMKRLSLSDVPLPYAETPKTPMCVASVTIFRPTTLGDDLFARFREHVAYLSTTAGAAWRAHFFGGGAAGREVKK
jgi:hypothetical protein